MAKDEMLRWPDWMPKPQRSGYGYEPVDRRTRTDMEVGSIYRVNFNSDEATVNCTLILNNIQSSWFETFEHKALNQGSKWFEIPLQTGGRIEWHKARFAARPKAGNLIGVGATTYTLRLDIEKREGRLCDSIAEMLYCISPEEFMDVSRTLASFTCPAIRFSNFHL